METGQGNIDILIKKPTDKNKQNVDSDTSIPGVHIINLEPKIKWAKKPLPTEIPNEGSHGGILFRKYDYKTKGSSDENKFSNMEIFIPGIGFGAGGFVVSGAGPVLLGSGSMEALQHICLPWVAIVLIITSIFWAVRHILLAINRKTIKETSCIEMNNNAGNWIHGAIVKDFDTNSRDISLLNENKKFLLSAEISKNSLSTMPIGPILSHTDSFSKYSGSFTNSLLKSLKNDTLKAASIASVLSDTSTLMGSMMYDPSTQLPDFSPMKTNQLVVCQRTGVIYTVSENKCPNSYSVENLGNLNLCQASKYNECVEVLLLARETILVGKMKSRFNEATDSPFILQTWFTADGRVKLGPVDPQPCLSLCSAKDEYLVILTKERLMVVLAASSSMVAEIPSPLTMEGLHNANIRMQSMLATNYTVICVSNTQNTVFFTVTFDDIKKVLSFAIMKTFPSTIFAIISTSELVIATTLTTLTLWNFRENRDKVVVKDCDQVIKRLFPSPTGRIVLILLWQQISVIQTDQWKSVLDIQVSCDQVCALALSGLNAGPSLLAIALYSGVIQIYDCSSYQFIKSMSIDKPVTYLSFDSSESLLVVSDRASKYLLKRFSLL